MNLVIGILLILDLSMYFKISVFPTISSLSHIHSIPHSHSARTHEPCILSCLITIDERKTWIFVTVHFLVHSSNKRSTILRNFILHWFRNHWELILVDICFIWRALQWVRPPLKSNSRCSTFLNLFLARKNFVQNSGPIKNWDLSLNPNE